MKILREFVIKHPSLKRIIKPVYLFFLQMLKKEKNDVVENAVSVPQVYSSTKKVIYFDITSHSVSNVKTGIQRVVAKFIDYIDANVIEEYEIVGISGLGGYHIIDKNTYAPHFELGIAPKEGDIYLSIDFNPVQPYEYWDTLKNWQENGCKLYACVYDLVYIKYPEYVADENAVMLLSRWLEHASTNFDGLICISKTVEEELLEWIKEKNIYNPRLKTGYFHLGGDFAQKQTAFKDSTQNFFSNYAKERPLIFLSVATVEPRKGYIELVEAFEQVAQNGINAWLVIVGRVGWKYDEIVRKITSSQFYNKSIFWFSDCEDNVLDILYKIADCYLSGSYYEGFGLGIIEASSKGLPVVLRDIPVNREVSENKGLYFNTVDELFELVKLASMKNSVLTGQEKVHSLSWEESVKMAWNVLRQMF